MTPKMTKKWVIFWSFLGSFLVILKMTKMTPKMTQKSRYVYFGSFFLEKVKKKKANHRQNRKFQYLEFSFCTITVLGFFPKFSFCTITVLGFWSILDFFPLFPAWNLGSFFWGHFLVIFLGSFFMKKNDQKNRKK